MSRLPEQLWLRSGRALPRLYAQEAGYPLCMDKKRRLSCLAVSALLAGPQALFRVLLDGQA